MEKKATKKTQVQKEKRKNHVGSLSIARVEFLFYIAPLPRS
jgi:hypothetical protein